MGNFSRVSTRQPFTVSINPIASREESTSTWLVDHEGLDPEAALIARESPEPDDEPRGEGLDLGLIERLPEEEGDVVSMYYIERKSQKEISKLIGCTQANISWLINRSFRRIRWMVGPGAWFTSEEFLEDCVGTLPAEHLAIMATFWSWTSQTAVGLRYGYSQGKIRHITHYGTAKLASLSYEKRLYSRYALGFSELATWGQGLLWTPERTAEVRNSAQRQRAQRPLTHHSSSSGLPRAACERGGSASLPR